MYLPTFTKTTQISKNNKFCRLNRQPTPLSGSGNDHPGQTSHPPSVGPYSWAPHESMCPWKTSVWGRRDPWELCKCNGHINLSKQQTFATYNNINNIHISFFHAHPKATHFHISCWYQKLSIAVISYLHNSAWCFGHSESTPFQQPHHFSGVFFCKCFNSRKLQPKWTTRIVNCEFKKHQQRRQNAKQSKSSEFWGRPCYSTKKHQNKSTCKPQPSPI